MIPYYNHVGVTLYHGDCLDVMPALEAQSFDAIIADIPSGRTRCAWDSVIPFDLMWAQLHRLIKPRGAIVLLGCTQPFTSALIMSNIKQFKYSWVWIKSHHSGFLNAKVQPMARHEDICVFGKGRVPYYPQMTKGARKSSRSGAPMAERKSNNGYGRTLDLERIYNDMYYPTTDLYFASGARADSMHPNQKPTLLLEYLIRTYTQPGDHVLDFTSGSGTTLRAAKNTDRHATGIEQEERDCATTAQRLLPAFESAPAAPSAALEDLPMFAGAE